MTDTIWAFASVRVGGGPGFEATLERCRNAEYRPGEFACHIGLALELLNKGEHETAAIHLKEFLRLSRAYGLMAVPWLTRKDWSLLMTSALELDLDHEAICALIESHSLEPTGKARCLSNWPWPVRIYATREWQLECQGSPMQGLNESSRQSELLQLLIDLGPRGELQVSLADRIWPGSTGKTARTSIQTTLNRLRGFFPKHAIVSRDGRIFLDDKVAFVDVWALERLLDEYNGLKQHPSATPSRAHRLSVIAREVPRVLSEEDLNRSSKSWRGTRAQNVLARVSQFYAERSNGGGRADPNTVRPLPSTASQAGRSPPDLCSAALHVGTSVAVAD